MPVQLLRLRPRCDPPARPPSRRPGRKTGGFLADTKYNGCVGRANAAGRYEFHQSCAGELSVGAPDTELARFERHYNAYQPHQALRQRTPMQACNENFNQSALAA